MTTQGSMTTRGRGWSALVLGGCTIVVADNGSHEPVQLHTNEEPGG